MPEMLYRQAAAALFGIAVNHGDLQPTVSQAAAARASDSMLLYHYLNLRI